MPPALAPAAPTNVRFLTGNTDAACRTSLGTTTGGALKVPPDGWIASALAAHIGQALLSGELPVTMHMLEYILMDVFVPTQTLSNRNIAWFIRPARLSDLIDDLLAAGLTNESGSPENVRARVKATAYSLTAAARLLTEADTISYLNATSGTWWDQTTHRAVLHACAGDPSSFMEFRMCFPGAYVDTHYIVHPFSTVVIAFLPPGIAALPMMAQNGAVLMHFAATRPESEALRVYVPTEDATNEMARRSRPTRHERFMPNLRAGWRPAYPAMNKAFPHECNGFKAEELIQTLAIALGHNMKPSTTQHASTSPRQ